MLIKEKNEGITVVSLVITVIVLLILTGISITALTGENGLIKNARKSKRTSRNRKGTRHIRKSNYTSNGK